MWDNFEEVFSTNKEAELMKGKLCTYTQSDPVLIKSRSKADSGERYLTWLGGG